MAIKSVYIKAGKERALVNKHPWLFSGAVLKKDRDIKIGDEIVVKDHAGISLALGHWCANDGLVCRLLTFTTEQALDEDFYLQRFQEALQLRRRFGFPSTTTTAYRLIHGEGDGLSGLVCDIFAHSASIQLTNPGLKKSLALLTNFLRDTLAIHQVHLHDAHEGASSWLVGSPLNQPFLEQGLLFTADIEAGQKTGHFLDQRDSREFVKSIAHNRDVLDNFCYSGGFSVYALAGGAKSVTSVDIAKSAIHLCHNNVSANGLKDRHTAIEADCFSYLRQIKKDEFDLIILDPPAFAKSAHAVDRAARGYKDINLLAFKAIRSGGLVASFSCSQHISEDLFQKIIFAAAKDAGRDVKIVKKLTQGADHPVSIYCPQSFYLKGLVLYVV